MCSDILINRLQNKARIYAFLIINSKFKFFLVLFFIVTGSQLANQSIQFYLYSTFQQPVSINVLSGIEQNKNNVHKIKLKLDITANAVIKQE